MSKVKQRDGDVFDEFTQELCNLSTPAFRDELTRILSEMAAHSDENDHLFRRKATTCSGRKRPVGRGCVTAPLDDVVVSVFVHSVKRDAGRFGPSALTFFAVVGRPRSQQEGPTRGAK